ncbi:MAG: long-chain fatty acid--CoA ligase [Micrococcales bacterium]|nr:long-chain fatty acid--CoA ligase [Micrococcales bacterium]
MASDLPTKESSLPNLAENLTASVHRSAGAIALRQDGQALTYAQLDEACAAFAGVLADRGIGAGDRVAVALPNIPAFAIVYYGALRVGAIVVPMNPLFKPREVAYYLNDSGASLLVGMAGDAAVGAVDADVGFVDVARLEQLLGQAQPRPDVIERDGSDPAVLLYTSGTTGHPKGAELTHSNLQTNQEVCARTLLGAGEGDVLMGCLPLFHVFGMTCGLNVAIGSGATLTLIPRFDPVKVLDVIRSDNVTIFEGVPTMYGAILAADSAQGRTADLASLRLCISGGASMPLELMRSFEERFNCVILEGYGLSETSPVASFNHPDKERKAGTIGTPIEGVRMRCVDLEGNDVPLGEVGEIVIAGENIMSGYWNRPAATAEAIRDGWFYSGDLGRIDEDGYFSIVDRTKDLIIRGGFNVYPREIEEVLYEHPAVAEAAVVGVPDERHGEDIRAYVVLKPEARATPQEIKEFTKERVAAYKYPRTVRIIDALPKGATGKILKRELRRDV